MAAVPSTIVKPRTRFTWLAFTVVLLIAFFLRFYRLVDHPLGLFYDAAINGLDAVRLMQRGGHSVFIPTNGGREALFVYLLIPFIWLFETTPFAVRALTATAGLLTVALLFGFLRSVSCLDLGRGRPIDSLSPPYFLLGGSLWLATLASLTLAVSYWHIMVSRLGVRAVLVAIFSVPMFWFFLKGWATQQKRWFVLSGLLMGLAGYTYFAGRLLPLILVLAVIPEFFIHPKERISKRGPNLLIFILSALIIFLPMGWYLLTHPTQFTTRAFSVMVWNFLDTPTDIVAELGRNTLRVLGFFCCVGNPNPIFGWPDQPGLPLLLSPFLLIGLIGALRNWRHLFYRLVALWWFVGLIASIISIEAPHPLRMIVSVVPTAILVALGLINFFSWLQKRITPYAWLPWLSFLIILVTLPSTFRAYFVDWTKLQATQGVYDYGAIAIRDAVLDHSDDRIPLYLPLARLNDSPLLFYLSHPFPRQAALQAAPADQALVISPEKNQADTTWVRLHNGIATVLPPLTGAGQQLIRQAFTDSPIPIRTISGETIALQALLPADPARFLQQPTRPLNAAFGPAQLTGIHYPAVIDPTVDRIPVPLYWQATRPMTDEYDVILQLVDDKRQVWGDGSGRPNDWVYPTTFWRPELDRVAAQHTIILEGDALAPGRYWLAVALFDPVRNQRLPLTTDSSDSPDTLFIGPLKVPLPSPAPISPVAEEITFDDVARLAGFEANQLTVAAGEPIQFTLLWEALSTPDRDYTVFVHLLDENDQIVAGHDTQPLAGHYPTSIWTPGEQILDPHALPTTVSLPPGQYRLAVGLYHQPTGERLPLAIDGHPEAEGRLVLSPPVIVAVRSE